MAKKKALMMIKEVFTEELVPYAKNSRTHSKLQIEQIAASIREFGFTNPVLIDAKSVIIAGHGRVMAAKELKLEKVPCIELGYLSEAQRKAYVIADNKLALNAGWDMDVLALELKELEALDFDLSVVGFDDEGLSELLTDPLQQSSRSETEYSQKIDAPVYEPKGEKPEISELIGEEKKEELLKRIKDATAPEPVKKFLRLAAARHNVFDYGKIAEFYCHADKELQELMEDSALVIIDFQSAMQNGYVKLKKEISELVGEQEEDDEE